MAHGGKREGAGRKPKSEELQVIERMDKYDPDGKVWEILWRQVKSGDVPALKLWLSYRYGAPIQQVNATNINTVKIVNESTDSSFTDPALSSEADNPPA